MRAQKAPILHTNGIFAARCTPAAPVTIPLPRKTPKRARGIAAGVPLG